MRYVLLAKFSLLLLVSSNILYPAAPPATKGWLSWISRGRPSLQQTSGVAAPATAPAAVEQPDLGELFMHFMTQSTVRDIMLERAVLSDRDVQALAHVNRYLRQSFQEEVKKRARKTSEEFEERAAFSGVNNDTALLGLENDRERYRKLSSLPAAFIDLSHKVDCRYMFSRLSTVWSYLHSEIKRGMRLDLVGLQDFVKPDQRTTSPRSAPIFVDTRYNNLGSLSSLKVFIDTMKKYTMDEFISQSHLQEFDRPVIYSLDLSGNGVHRIEPETFAALGGLRELRLTDNALTVLEPETFKGLHRLKRLDLQANPIHLLLEGSFHDLSNVQELNLANSSLDILYPGEFAGLDNLRKLNLSTSRITEIQPGAFNGLRNIEEIDLSFLPNLRSLDPGVFAELTTLQTIKLAGNDHLRDIVPALRTLYPGVTINY